MKDINISFKINLLISFHDSLRLPNHPAWVHNNIALPNKQPLQDLEDYNLEG